MISKENPKRNYNMTDILFSTQNYERPRHYLSAKSPVNKPSPQIPSSSTIGKLDRYYIYSAKKVRQDLASIKNEEDVKVRIARSSPSQGNKRTSDDRKTVSRNISMVLENLLMSYENSQLPTHGQGM